MKQETKNYLEIVGSIFDILSESIEKFNTGSNSLIPCIIGDEEWNYFLNR